MRALRYALIVLLVLLQYPLWLGNGGVLALWRLERRTAEQRVRNGRYTERNAALAAEVADLKTGKGGLAAVQAHARTDLGMIRKGETYFQLAPSQLATSGGEE